MVALVDLLINPMPMTKKTKMSKSMPRIIMMMQQKIIYVVIIDNDDEAITLNAATEREMKKLVINGTAQKINWT